jgi:hypothetical protein
MLTPGVFISKSQWVLRSLTADKVLVAKDFNKVLTDLLTSGPLTTKLVTPVATSEEHATSKCLDNKEHATSKSKEHTMKNTLPAKIQRD